MGLEYEWEEKRQTDIQTSRTQLYELMIQLATYFDRKWSISGWYLKHIKTVHRRDIACDRLCYSPVCTLSSGLTLLTADIKLKTFLSTHFTCKIWARHRPLSSFDLHIVRFTQYEISIRLLQVNLHKINNRQLPILNLGRDLNFNFNIPSQMLILNWVCRPDCNTVCHKRYLSCVLS